TRSARIGGWVGRRRIECEILVDVSGEWRFNGRVCPELHDCHDVDLNFSPSTNLLSIRRLNLAIGQAADAKAAWLRFPTFELEPLDQTYRRLGAYAYRYESAGGDFVAELQVNSAGFVTEYPQFW